MTGQILEISDLSAGYDEKDILQEISLIVREKSFVGIIGPNGCGKTTTAKAIANALGKPILILNLSNVVCSRIGETSQNIKQVFDKAAREKAVLFQGLFQVRVSQFLSCESQALRLLRLCLSRKTNLVF